MLNEWLIGSIGKHFKVNLHNIAPVFTIGLQKEDEKAFPRYEVRVDGPIKKYLTRTVIEYILQINILILSKTEGYDHSRLVDKALESLEKQIEIKKLTSTNEIIGCLRADEDYIITNYGILQPDLMINQTTIEQEFSITP